MGTPGPIFVAPGKIGGHAEQLETSGTNSLFNWIRVGVLPDFAFTETDSFSVSWWVNYTNWQHDLPFIENAMRSTYQPGWVFAERNGQIEFLLTDTVKSYVADPAKGSPIIDDGRWHNIAGVVDRAAQSASVYVDGVMAGSFSIAGLGSLDYCNALVIGQDPSGSYGADLKGLGLFDDISIGRRALSPTEAESIYLVGQNYGRTFDTYGPVALALKPTIGGFDLIWHTGNLLSSDTVNGAYLPVVGASAPYFHVTPATTGNKFYRVQF
jgi:hypothetical protein